MGAHLFQPLLEPLDSSTDEAAVCLDLGLAGASGANTASQALQMGPLAGQSGEKVFVLGELYLEVALLGDGVTREDVDNQGGPIDDFDLESVLQDLLLRGGQLVVQNDGVGVLQPDDFSYLFDLALAEVGASPAVQALGDDSDDPRAGCAGKLRQLCQ